MIRRIRTHDDELDPVVAAELQELERALAGAPGADPVLSALVRDVRDQVPDLTGPARSDLDARVTSGFAADRPGGRLRRFVAPRPALRTALGAAATAVLALVVASAALTGGDDARPVTSSAPPAGGIAEDGAGTAGEAQERSGGDEAARAPSPSGTAAPQSSATAPAPPTTTDPGGLGGPRRVERAAQMTLSTAPQDVQAVSDAVIRTVQSLGGVVASSQITTTDDGGEAVFDLRLPAARLDRAIAELSRLAHVSALVQESDDITGTVVSTASRLQDARDERRALLKALARAKSDRQVSSLRARIADSRRRIASLEGALRGLRARTDRATVGLTVRGDRASQDTGGAAWTPADALRDAARVLEVTASVLVVVAAILVPAGLLVVPALIAARSARRRARSRALDAV